MADSDEKTPEKPTNADKPKAKTPKAKPEGVEAAVSAGPEESTPPAATSAETPAAAAPEAPAKPAKKPAKAKKEEPAPVEAPKENLSLNPDDVEKPKIIKAKGSKNVHTGIAHVLSTFNNTIVTITDLKGNVIGWSKERHAVAAAHFGFRSGVSAHEKKSRK